MEATKKKCSLLEHKEIDAILFCEECKIYLCNKCESYHSKLFPIHHTYNSEKDLMKYFQVFAKKINIMKNLNFFVKPIINYAVLFV